MLAEPRRREVSKEEAFFRLSMLCLHADLLEYPITDALLSLQAYTTLAKKGHTCSTEYATFVERPITDSRRAMVFRESLIACR